MALTTFPLTLHSKLDDSVNFVSEGAYPGMIEARYVRRAQEYFIAYLSCQTGCAKACRFCHLTQSGQTKYVDCSTAQIFAQAQEVMAHYDIQASSEPARSVHFNFMARGEPFASGALLHDGYNLLDQLSSLARARGIQAKVKISTIFPSELESVEDIALLFGGYAPDIYYSFYSTNEKFRRHWMPKAMPYHEALRRLKRYQESTRKIPVIHGAMIKDENDREEDIRTICEAVKEHDLRVDVNIVRYNPFSAKQGSESDENVVLRNVALYQELLPGARIKVVTRVGFDVKASCGMFVNQAEDL